MSEVQVMNDTKNWIPNIYISIPDSNFSLTIPNKYKLWCQVIRFSDTIK